MIKAILSRLLGPKPAVREERWRMPPDQEHARAVYARWDRLNGRYYQRADVRLPDGTILKGIVFDSDTRIAVTARGRPIPDQPDLHGVEVEILHLYDQ